MRKTIYVPSQEVWDEVKRKADEAGTTVSKYLLGSNHVPDLWVGDQLDRIEEKLDNFLKVRGKFPDEVLNPDGSLKSV